VFAPGGRGYYYVQATKTWLIVGICRSKNARIAFPDGSFWVYGIAMILITGGAGFIGSNLQAALAMRGHETVVVDRLGSDDKWRNLAKHPPARLIPPEELDAFLETRPPLEMVFHLGAISETTARDGDLTWAVNVELSRRIWHWCATREVRMVYASSAATYGDGTAGFDDDQSLEALDRLRPLNLYGWTKHAFDLRVANAVATRGEQPPQWVGLKFFNVYGPNEYHKGSMISVVKVKYDEVAAGGSTKLFRSDVAGLADGQQKRDFIWIGDVVDVMLWLLDTPGVKGLFNLGTGQARSYLDLAHAVCDAAGQPRQVEFVDMPTRLRGQYQSFTQASMDRLRGAGYAGQFTPLEEGVRRYVQGYLARADSYV
jgi:ADP-L-glycero-D-manno-heptose 6-epimerase